MAKIPLPKGLNLKENSALNWRIFKQKFEMYLKVSGKSNKENVIIKVTILPSYFNTFGLDYKKGGFNDILKTFDIRI